MNYLAAERRGIPMLFGVGEPIVGRMWGEAGLQAVLLAEMYRQYIARDRIWESGEAAMKLDDWLGRRNVLGTGVVPNQIVRGSVPISFPLPSLVPRGVDAFGTVEDGQPVMKFITKDFGSEDLGRHIGEVSAPRMPPPRPPS